MIRFIIKRKSGDATINLNTEDMYTIDCNVPELEEALTSGGVSQYGYEKHELKGVEILIGKEAK